MLQFRVTLSHHSVPSNPPSHQSTPKLLGVTSIIPTHTVRIAVSPTIPALTQIRGGWGQTQAYPLYHLHLQLQLQIPKDFHAPQLLQNLHLQKTGGARRSDKWLPSLSPNEDVQSTGWQ